MQKISAMAQYFEMLMQDVRMKEGLSACMNCGVCTGVCPAAEFYSYDPRQIVDIIQSKDNAAIEELLKGETIWYCGECMSCRPRCPRGNTPAYIIQALRILSQKLGFFVESEKGRQQLALKRVIGHAILEKGYCIYPRLVAPAAHPEQGPAWQWIWDNHTDVYEKFSSNYLKPGPGAARAIDPETIKEINDIFEVTGGKAFFETIEAHSQRKAREMDYDDADDKYFNDIYTYNSGGHNA